MTAVKVIGVGMGEPGHLTGQAVEALRSVEVFVILEKGTAADELAGIRKKLCRHVMGARRYRFVELADPPRDRAGPDYEQSVEDWTEARAGLLVRALEREVGPGGTAGMLAWGDPAFYDSTLRVLSSPATGGQIDVEVVPGISSIQMLAAAHRLSLTRPGRSLQFTTGRRLAAEGFPPGCDDVVVMLDGQCSFRAIDPRGVSIYWGAHLGGAHQVLVAGRLSDVADQIVARRADARARRGWVMDTYLLRRDLPSR